MFPPPIYTLTFRKKQFVMIKNVLGTSGTQIECIPDINTLSKYKNVTLGSSNVLCWPSAAPMQE